MTYGLAITALGVVVLVLAWSSVIVVQQGTVAVVMRLGRAHRVLQPGPHLRFAGIDRVHRRVSTRNRALEVTFPAVSADRATVTCSILLLYVVSDATEATIRRVVFEFADEESFRQTFTRWVEVLVREQIERIPHASVTAQRDRIVAGARPALAARLEGWGYRLLDLRLAEVAFDETVSASLAEVAAASNLRLAASERGAAAMISRTFERAVSPLPPPPPPVPLATASKSAGASTARGGPVVSLDSWGGSARRRATAGPVGLPHDGVDDFDDTLAELAALGEQSRRSLRLPPPSQARHAGGRSQETLPGPVE